MNQTYQYKSWGELFELHIFRTHYIDNGRLAIGANTTLGEPFGLFTININDGPLAENEAYIDTNNMPNAVDFLVNNGLAERTNRVGKSGFCTYPVVKIFLDKIEEVEE